MPAKIKTAGYAASVSVGSEAPGARSLQGVPKFQAAGRSSAFLHREEVAVQRRGVTAGAEVHNCLGAVGRLQRKRELCAWSGDTVPIGHISFLHVGSRS